MQSFDLSFDNIANNIVAFLPRLGLAILVYLVARAIAAWTTKLLRQSMERRERDPELIVLLEMLTRWGILALGIVLALEQLAPGRFSSLIAGLGIAGFTIGFALQDVTKNFVAGILLLIQRPFEIGDAIEVAGYGGTVLDISLRSTDLRTWDGRHVLIPNGDIFVSPIVNFSRATRRRVQITVGVAYDTDLDKVTRVALEALKDVPGLLQDPAPSLVFSNIGDSTIELSIYFWIDTDVVSLGTAQDAGIKAIKKQFEHEGIEIPFYIRIVLTTER